MAMEACIRKEYKGRWEGRTPLTPEAVRALRDRVTIKVERSDVRTYDDAAYAAAGAELVDDGAAAIVLGIKEPPIEIIGAGEIHLCFSHTIKGQPYNMGLLRTFMARGCTLIDYETMRDETGTRVIAFGRYAGIAGAVDTFYVAGQKYAQKGMASPLADVAQTYRYGTLEQLRGALGAIQLNDAAPVRVVIVGTGNVGRGAAEVCDWMGLPRIEVAQLEGTPPAGSWYCVLGTSDVVAAKDGSAYDKDTYRAHGAALYDATFERFLGKFDILLQTPYWEEKYPYLLPRDVMAARADDLPPVIGDISCDIHGSLACTFRESSIDAPAYTYLPDRHEVVDGISWDGPTVMAIGHLPCELALDASAHFSKILTTYLPEIAEMDVDQPLEACGLGRLLQDATIVYKGELTARYAHLKDALSLAGV